MQIERIKRISTDLYFLQMKYPFSIRTIRVIGVPKMPKAFPSVKISGNSISDYLRETYREE